ncbi:unnamed protein product [Parajaminaea phylloscopi]
MPRIVLTSDAPRPATLPTRISELLEALLLVWVIFRLGTLPAIKEQFARPRLLSLVSPWVWRDAIWGHAMPEILRMSDEDSFDAKKGFISHAGGKVLEVGAGSGETIKFYDEGMIDTLYALEPFAPAIPHLAKTIAARGKGFESRTQIIHAGIEDQAALSRHGITANSLDSLVLVRCLCSIPGGPEAHLHTCLRLLKPGGSLIMIEHGLQHGDALTRSIQRVLDGPWSFLANGCHLTRDSLGTLRALDACDDMLVQRPQQQTAASLIPFVYVKATKRSTP